MFSEQYIPLLWDSWWPCTRTYLDYGKLNLLISLKFYLKYAMIRGEGTRFTQTSHLELGSKCLNKEISQNNKRMWQYCVIFNLNECNHHGSPGWFSLSVAATTTFSSLGTQKSNRASFQSSSSDLDFCQAKLRSCWGHSDNAVGLGLCCKRCLQTAWRQQAQVVPLWPLTLNAVYTQWCWSDSPCLRTQ